MPIRAESSAKPFTSPSVRSASDAASREASLACDTRRAISAIDAESSSAAVATVWTEAEACSLAAATAPDW